MSKTDRSETAAPAVGAPLDGGVRPCGWRWLDSWVFRKRVPSYSTRSEWGPVYDQQALDAALTAERERAAPLDAELQEVLDWARKEQAPLREQEIASIVRVLAKFRA